jgi:hypothetical protein
LSPQAVLLVGSPRGSESTSNSLGSYLLDKLENAGYTNSKYNLQSSLHQPEKEAALLSAVAESDIVVLAFPLYVDSPPAPVINVLEKIAQQRKKVAAIKPQKLLAIVNNGFPQSIQNATAIKICQQFAVETNFEWLCGLSLGGGGAINGVPLSEVGGYAKNIRKALDLTAESLLSNQPVPETAMQLISKPLVPKSLFLFFGNRSWKRLAKQFGAEKKLYDKPAKN